MEIPSDLKQLYKHWDSHTFQHTSYPSLELDHSVLNRITPFITERMRIWEKKQTLLKPYTQDPVLLKYRLCNIYRELDRQTIEIHTKLKSLESDFSLWLLNVLFYRMVCKTETIDKVGLLSYGSSNNQKVKNTLLNLDRPKYGTAYIFPISIVNKVGCTSREDFLCQYLPSVTKDCASLINNMKKMSVVAALEKIIPNFKANFKFHWTEVLIDVAYQYPKHIDLFGRFPIGPGSLPTMRSLNRYEDPEKVCLALTSLNLPNFPYLSYEGRVVRLSAENWEGIGCEFRKYTNLSLGAGRKRLYKA